MRRWARTRFIPDDCGLKPPIETLPQSAQERAMRGPQLLVGRRAAPEGAERSGRIAHGLRDPAGRRPPARHQEDVARVSTIETPGRILVTRRAIIDIVRDTTLNSYGVTGFAASRVERLLGRLGFAQPGIDVRLAGGLSIALGLTVALRRPDRRGRAPGRFRQSATAFGATLGREVDGLTIHVAGVAYTPATVAPPAPIRRGATEVHARDVSDRGTDVA